MANILIGGRAVQVSEEDVSFLSSFNWRIIKYTRGDYAATNVYLNGKRKTVLMHRLIMGAEDGEIIDHKNRVPLNNDRQNLRFATAALNIVNRKAVSACGVRGVSKCPNKTNPWVCVLAFKGVRLWRGFPTIVDATVAYDFAADALYGDYAPLNFPGVKIEPPAGWRKQVSDWMIKHRFIRQVEPVVDWSYRCGVRSKYVPATTIMGRSDKNRTTKEF